MKSRSGFTLVELIVAVVVVAILASVGVVAYSGIRQKAYDATVEATLDTVEKSFRAFALKEGNVIKMRYYSYNDFNANPGGGWTDSSYNTQVFNGGGIGTAMKQRGVLSSNLLPQLKGGPNKDLSLKNGIKFVTCGKNKFFFVIESYDGIIGSELNQKLWNLSCAQKTQEDWLADNGFSSVSAGFASGNYKVQPHYKYREIDL